MLEPNSECFSMKGATTPLPGLRMKVAQLATACLPVKGVISLKTRIFQYVPSCSFFTESTDYLLDRLLY